MHVLIVEDDDFNRLLLESIIERTKHTFQSVANGLEAIHATQREHFDLIFMDIHMPIMGGIEAIQQIRQNILFKHQPIIIIITSDEMALLELDSKVTDINGFLVKPVSIAAINNFLR